MYFGHYALCPMLYAYLDSFGDEAGHGPLRSSLLENSLTVEENPKVLK